MKKLLLFCLLAISICGCANNKQNKEEKILVNVAVQYIDSLKEDIDSLESVMRKDGSYNNSIVFSITQSEDYMDYKAFFINIEPNLRISKVPTYLGKRNNRYIAMYLNGRKPLDTRNIPGFLFEESQFPFWIGGACYVIMCSECKKTTAIYTLDNYYPYHEAMQINDLARRCDHKWNGKVKLEEAIFDDTEE